MTDRWRSWVIALALPLVASAAGQAPAAEPGTGPFGRQRWATRFDGQVSRPDQGWAIAGSPDGTRVFVARTAGFYNPSDAVTVAIDASTGDRLWAATYEGLGGPASSADDLVVSPDGERVFVVGAVDEDYLIVALDAWTGATRWRATYNGPGGGTDSALSVGVSPDGSRVFVTGASAGAGSMDDYATIAYDADHGSRLWVARYNGNADRTDAAGFLAVSPDGDMVYVTGSSVGSNQTDFATVAYDAATGQQKWVSRYDGPASVSDDAAAAVRVSPDGSHVYVTGSSGNTANVDTATVAYAAATGIRRWTSRFDGGISSDNATSLAVSMDGSRVFVGGYSDPTQSHVPDYLTIALTAATGRQQWAARYDGPIGESDYVNSIAASTDGAAVYVTGSSYGDGTLRDFATLAYDAVTGRQRWLSRYDGPALGYDWDGGISVIASPDGNGVFVAGASVTEETGSDITTLSYDSGSGDQVWLNRQDFLESGFDVSRAVAMSPEGSRVFVTGQSYGEGTTGGYATVGYGVATGAEEWRAAYDTTVEEGATALTVSPDGARVFVTGRGNGLDDRFATVAYDAQTGTELWVARETGEGGTSVVVSPDGSRVFVTGEIYSSYEAGYDDQVIALDASTGAEIWVATYDGGRDEFPSALAISTDGSRVVVTGATTATKYRFDYLTVSFDAITGQRDWASVYAGPGGGDDVASALAVGPDGSGVFVTGGSEGRTSGQDFATVAYDAATGEEAWVARYGGASDDEARSLAIAPDGQRLFVTGTAEVTRTDAATVAYASRTGERLWAVRQGTPTSSESSSSVAVSPDGALVYTGGLSNVAGTKDLVTDAYEASSGILAWRARYDGPVAGRDIGSFVAVTPDGSLVIVAGSSMGTDADFVTIAYEAARVGIRG